MKFSALLIGALAALVNAKAEFTNSQFVIEAGQPFDLKWTGASGPVTINLKNGPNNDLKTVMTIDQNDSGSSFSWTPPSTLPSGLYAFEIIDSTNVPNYSIQWNFQGTASASLSTSSTTVTSGSTTSTSASTTTHTSSTTTQTSSTTTQTSSTTTNTSSSSSTKSSSSSTKASSTSATPTSTPANTSDGLRAKSPLALVLCAVAALMYFN